MVTSRSPASSVWETVDVLAAWAPRLREALTGRGENDFVILDGTLIPTDRVAADEPYDSQKHNKHGMNMQAVAAPDGTPLWFRGPCPDTLPYAADPRPGRPRPPGRRRHRPHPELPPP